MFYFNVPLPKIDLNFIKLFIIEKARHGAPWSAPSRPRSDPGTPPSAQGAAMVAGSSPTVVHGAHMVRPWSRTKFSKNSYARDVKSKNQLKIILKFRILAKERHTDVIP